jgi:hypothetical protein
MLLNNQMPILSIEYPDIFTDQHLPPLLTRYSVKFCWCDECQLKYQPILESVFISIPTTVKDVDEKHHYRARQTGSIKTTSFNLGAHGLVHFDTLRFLTRLLYATLLSYLWFV